MKCTKQALEKLAKSVVGKMVTDENGNQIGEIVSAEIKQGDVVATAKLGRIVPNAYYITFNLGLEAVE